MAELKVEVVKIDEILNHPNADRMELAMVGGYQVCVQYGAFVAGDLVVYIPIDSLLPESLEALIFGPDSKVKLHKHRVRAIKLRGAVSQGMVIPLKLAAQYPGCYNMLSVAREGLDMTSALNIIKYLPPTKLPNAMSGKAAPKRHCHPMFSKYTSINHLKKYWNAFMDGDEIVITEKIHGTNFRAGWVPFIARTGWQKIKKFFGKGPVWEFVYGSHNVQLMDGKGKDAFAGNVYKRIADDHNLAEKIPMGQLWYGEIFGDNIQTGYEYGFKDGKVSVAFMDIKDVKLGEYLDFSEVIAKVEAKGEQVVPHMLTVFNAKDLMEYLNDPQRVSFIDAKTKPIEGFVVRPVKEQTFYGGRLILKVLSDAYLLRKDNSDWK